MVVPIKLAIATWRIEEVCPSCSPPKLSTLASLVPRSPMQTQALLSPPSTEYYSSRPTSRNPESVGTTPDRTARPCGRTHLRETGLHLQRCFDEVEPVVAPEHLVPDEEGRGAEDTPLQRLGGRILEILLRTRTRRPLKHLFGFSPHPPGDGGDRCVLESLFETFRSPALLPVECEGRSGESL